MKTIIARRWLGALALGLFLAALYALSYNRALERQHEKQALRSSATGIWMLPDTALQALAGEFKGLMADYLTMEAGAQLGTRIVQDGQGGFRAIEMEHDWRSVLRIFQAAQALDPSFAQTFLLAQGWLPWPPANLVQETQDFLQVSAKYRPWDWQPLRTMGFNEFYFNKDRAAAAQYYLEAAKTPNGPNFLAIIGSRLGQEAGETETAILMMQSMLAGKGADEPGYTELAHRLQALQGVFTLENARDSFHKNNGRLPRSLSELLQSGTLQTLPVNPYQLPYCINGQGQIFFDKPDCADEAEHVP